MHYPQILGYFIQLLRCSHLHLDIKDPCTWFLQSLELLQGLVPGWASSSGDQHLVPVLFHELFGVCCWELFQPRFTAVEPGSPQASLSSLASCTTGVLHVSSACETTGFFFKQKKVSFICSTFVLSNAIIKLSFCFNYWWLQIDLKAIVLAINDQHVVVFNFFANLSVGMNK